MKKNLARKAVLQPFPVLRQIGLSSACMQRLERYRSKHERLSHTVGVLSWPDGTWCAVAMHTEKLGHVTIDDGQKTDAYEDACSMIDAGYLPLLSLRWEFHA